MSDGTDAGNGGGGELGDGAMGSGGALGGSGGSSGTGEIDVLNNVGSIHGENGGSGKNNGFYGVGGGGGGGAGAVVIGAGPNSNEGTIQGGAGGSGAQYEYNAYTVGTAAEGGSGGAGALFTAAGVTFTNSGTISGGFGGSGGSNLGGIGVVFTSPFTFLNLTGASASGGGGGNGVFFVTGPSTNGGSGAAGVVGDAGTINNAGTITGGNAGIGPSSPYNYGPQPLLYAGNGITGTNLVVTNSGTITGGAGEFEYPQSGAGGVGISSDNLVLRNTGQISGGQPGGPNYDAASGSIGVAGGNLTITNGGTISAPSGATGYAIVFTGSTNSLTFLNSSSGINGGIAVGSGAILQFVQPTASSLASTISGAGSVNKMGAGALLLSGTSTYSGGTVISEGTLELATPDVFTKSVVTSGAVGTGPIQFGGLSSRPAVLALDAAAQPASGGTYGTTLAYFGTGDSLDLKGAVPTNAAPVVSGNTLTVATGSGTEAFTLLDGAAAYTEQSDGSGGTLVRAVVCFTTGTLIRTERDEKAVEDLRVGDLVVTSSGDYRPIRWIGHRTLDCRAFDAPRSVWPVRIAADAFGRNRPARDLLVSPEHSLCVDVVNEVLIPACDLVNGSTVAYVEDAGEVTYWHVELDSHDIIWANGMPVESFLEMGENRSLLGLPIAVAAATDIALARSHADFCRPFHRAGPLVNIVRSQLALRAASLGWTPCRDAEIAATIAGGQELVVQSNGGYAFIAVPEAPGTVRIVSATHEPASLGEADERQLGLAVYNLELFASDGTCRTLDLDRPAVAKYFHEGERRRNLAYRWTRGELVLPEAFTAGLPGPMLVRLRYEVSTIRRYQGPAECMMAIAAQ